VEVKPRCLLRAAPDSGPILFERLSDSGAPGPSQFRPGVCILRCTVIAPTANSVPGRVTLPPSQNRPPSTDGPSFYKLRYTTVRLCALIVGRRRIGLEPRHSSLFGRHTMLASSQPSAPNAFNHLASRNISFSFDVSAARTAKKASAATLSLSPLSSASSACLQVAVAQRAPYGSLPRVRCFTV
jgi:hypothetical protein